MNKAKLQDRMLARRQHFLELLEQIENGEFGEEGKPPSVSAPRREYESPVERSSHNYGYMTSAEIGSGNSEAL